MTSVFLCGPLADGDLRQIVLGSEVPLAPARLPGFALVQDRAGFSAAVVPGPGITVDGYIAALAPDTTARLVHYAQAMGWLAQHGLVIDGWPDPVTVFASAPDGDPAWDAKTWETRFAPQERVLAADIMQLMGMIGAEVLAARLASLRVRAASRLRAGAAAPANLRQRPDARSVAVDAMRQPYAQFFAIEEYDLTVRRFDGARSPRMTRAVFVTGDAVTVLPFDPRRDRVLLIEQFRAGPMGRGDPIPWSLEAVAGRIDAGESPEDAGRREAVEEAGLTLGQFWPVASYYPSPAAKTEYLYSFVAEADLPDGVAGLHGLADEAEDIKGHLVSFDALMEMVTTGEIGNAPLILTAFWLARERPRLRAELVARGALVPPTD